ncbi:glucuronate isomerase [Bifidobacterium vansinderenii]|uniref:Uronate isomerase n=1 Tax=Bifidobacterium vansinderenii TaxID=1984871 RepID=A0A229W101_9BIFI|nr:glucuronate isomerase [Bifidobacterium vansinderenii]OXN01506.1 glucuronate isomerase [Bifidobacterium vansinderenii]
MAFMDDDYLLTTDLAKELFHGYAESMPIVDYHCHLHPEEIYKDPNFKDIVEAWLTDGNNYGDHYKWRLERANGVPEELITGNGDPWDKFYAYAQTMEKAIGSPVYMWTHQELRRYFGITDELNTKTAKAIYEKTNEMLATPEFSRRSLLRRMNLDTICTTDDPVDSLEYHIAFEKEGGDTFKMIPAMRPDKALNPDKPGFSEWVDQLEQVTGDTVNSFDDMMAAINKRVDFFHEHGSRLSDHAADLMLYAPSTAAERDAILAKARAGEPLTLEEVTKYRTQLFLDLMKIYHAHGWTMQLHIHAMRNINEREFGIHGPDTGYDSINDRSIAEPLAALLNEAAKTDSIPKMLIYSLNPNDYLAITTIMGCFQGGMKQRMALGNAWWFNDTRTGIRKQIQTMAEGSLLGNFVGMTTDSRSFLSFPRHEFFRRILCEQLGEWASRGEIPSDLDTLAPLVQDVSYNNAKELFA